MSNALSVLTSGKTDEAVRHAMAVIDRVHDDGGLPMIYVTQEKMKDSYGGFSRSRRNNKSLRVKIDPRVKFKAFTTVHELGHFIDNSGLWADGGGFFSADGQSAEIKNWFAAISDSAAYKRIVSAADLKPFYRDYLLSKHELWARSYAQYIVEKSGDKTLLAELNGFSKKEPYMQWDKKDFAPVKKAMDALFGKKG